MLAIGVDAHKAVHVAVAVDAAGREVARWRGANSGAGWQELAAWAVGLGTSAAGVSRGRGTTGAGWRSTWSTQGRWSTRSIPAGRRPGGAGAAGATRAIGWTHGPSPCWWRVGGRVTGRRCRG